MKKVFGLFFTLSVIVFCSNIILAEPVFPEGNLTTNPIQVVADFRGKGKAEFSIELRNISNDEDVTQQGKIDWLVQDITLNQSSNQWKWSTTYAVIKSTVTDHRVNYYLYQKNKQSTEYKAVEPRTNEDPETHVKYPVYSGLVNKELQGGEYRGYIPLSFLFTAEKLSSSELNKDYDPDKYDPGKGSKVDDKVSRYFKDEGDSDFGENFIYTLVACANTGGIAFYPYGDYGPWTPESVQQSKTAYMYFGGNFINVQLDDVFGTDQIFIIKVVE